ncbi:MAG: hypothetical protein ABI267_04400 [Ginsengibacter sp.]
MRKTAILLIIFSSIVFSNCGSPSQNTNEKITEDISAAKDTFQLLTQYWELKDADHPLSSDVSFTNDAGILYDPGIVFMGDSSVLENPVGKMSYGKFSLKGNTIHVNFDDGAKAVYIIDRINKDELVLSRTEKKQTSQLTYKSTNTSWPRSDKNPFAKQNYAWSQKPQKSETDAEIKDRVKQYVQFCVYYFDGYINGGAAQIDFNAFPTCLDWYQGGLTIQNENKLDKKWTSCFYSQDQAYKGRQMLEDAIVKKYNWDEKETNWMKQIVPVLQQIHDGM